MGRGVNWTKRAATVGERTRRSLTAAAVVEGDALRLRGVVLPPDGSKRIEDAVSGPADAPEELGKRLAAMLLAKGARELLEAGGIVVPR